MPTSLDSPPAGHPASRRTLAWTSAAIVAACAALAAGCGGSSSPGTTTSGGPAATTTGNGAPTTTTPGSGGGPTDAKIEGHELDRMPPVHRPSSPAPSPGSSTGVDRAYLRRVFNSVQTLWRQEFSSAGATYTPARLSLFRSEVHSGCGLQRDVGPFYCPASRTVYLDLPFFEMLAKRAGVGAFAQAYVIGHEVGHHLQHLTGIQQRVAAADHADPTGENARSVLVELQADCLAGVWAHGAYRRGEATPADLEDALRTAALIGDDFQAQASGRTVDPGLFTHGSSAQRQHWFTVGLDTGRPGACDTFAGG